MKNIKRHEFRIDKKELAKLSHRFAKRKFQLGEISKNFHSVAH